ncbi:hypothetical protein TNCV_4984351 [Trichonephila clavipes]|nr:hypothetical protein TNCV_4984351 [Trichonephila clavipes]
MLDGRKQHKLENDAHMAFYAFVKIGQRCNGIMVDHGLEVYPQPKVANIYVGGSRRPSYRLQRAQNYTMVTTFAYANGLYCTMPSSGDFETHYFSPR